MSAEFFSPDPAERFGFAVATDGSERHYIFDGERIGEMEFLIRLGPQMQQYAEQMQEAVRDRRDPTSEEMEFAALDPRTMLFETTRRRLEKCMELPERSSHITELKAFARRTLDNPSVDYALPMRDIDEDVIYEKLSRLGPVKCGEHVRTVMSDLAEARPALRELLLGDSSSMTEALLDRTGSQEVLHSLCTLGTLPRSSLRPFPAGFEREFSEFSSKKLKRNIIGCAAGCFGLWTGANAYARMADLPLYYSLPLLVLPFVAMNMGMTIFRRRPPAKDFEIFTAAAATLHLIEPMVFAPHPVRAGLELFGGKLPNKHKWIETGNCVVALSLFQTPLRTIISDSVSATYNGTTNKVPRLRARVISEARRWGVQNREEFTRLYKALHTRRVLEEYELRMDVQERVLKAINFPLS